MNLLFRTILGWCLQRWKLVVLLVQASLPWG
jgi:hypothetical protein